MPYLNYTQLLTSTGLVPAGVNIVYIDRQLDFWSNQINQLTNQSFNSTLVKSIVKSINQCGQSNLYFSAFLNDINFKVEYKAKGSSTWLVATLNTNYTLLHPNFDTFVSGLEIDSPIIGIDFKCLKCICECVEFRITGVKSWSTALPDDLHLILIELAKTSLSYDPNSYTSGMLPMQSQFNLMESDSDQTRTTRWYRDRDNIAIKNKMLLLGFDNPLYTSILSKYQRASLNINYRFNA